MTSRPFPDHGELVPATSRDLAAPGPAPLQRPTPQRPWTAQDFIWWNTAGVLTAVTLGARPNPVSPVVDPVRRAFAPEEVMLGSCDAELLMFRRGDATYNPSRGFFLAGGPVGLALTAAFFGGQAYMNSRRRKAAEADAQARWRHLADARLTVSTHGIYLGTAEGVMSVAYADVRECSLSATGEIIMAAANSQGTARWKLRAQWAELVLVLWALRYLPEHPQLTARSWLPGDWLVHAAAHGYEVDTRTWPR